jgi:hypothetical protein
MNIGNGKIEKKLILKFGLKFEKIGHTTRGK